MAQFEYKVVPAPRQPAKRRGRLGAGDRFALTLAETINEAAEDGWEYLRAERLPCETREGLWRRLVQSEQTVLIFRRQTELAEPAARAGAEPTALRALPGRVPEPARVAPIGPASRDAPLGPVPPIKS